MAMQHANNGRPIVPPQPLLHATVRPCLSALFPWALVNAKQPAVLHVHALILLFFNDAPWPAPHLSRSLSIRPLPFRLHFTEVMSRSCLTLVPWPFGGLLALELSHASRRVTSCFQILDGHRLALRGTVVHA